MAGPPGLPLCSVAFVMHRPLEMNACEHVQGGHALSARFICVKTFGTHCRRHLQTLLSPHLSLSCSAAPRSIRTQPGLGRLGGGRFTFAHTAVGPFALRWDSQHSSCAYALLLLEGGALRYLPVGSRLVVWYSSVFGRCRFGSSELQAG
jgi:hypothetical protein